MIRWQLPESCHLYRKGHIVVYCYAVCSELQLVEGASTLDAICWQLPLVHRIRCLSFCFICVVLMRDFNCVFHD